MGVKWYIVMSGVVGVRYLIEFDFVVSYNIANEINAIYFCIICK